MFERSLSALIKGLRSHRGKDEPKYVAQVMDEIRHEVRSGDLEVKAEAVLKLTYLQMLGYPFSGANFHMLETMASSKYHHKHIGYLAAAQCFSADTDVLILSTNMIKKDLQASNPLDVAVALNGLAHIATPDLARHLGPDVIKLLTHSKPMIRKKAILVLYALIIKSPDLLETGWDRLREKLDDPDLSVVSAAVNIICELARRDPRPFLPLSPQLFRLLTTSTNNWMLIKIIKLFGSLTPLEPRLVKKLVPPISTIISTTPAMSLLYECIHTIIIGGMLTQPGGDDLAEICVEKLAAFLTDSDQNLKYIALLALVKILPSHPHLVARHQDVIFESIEDPDLSIRLRALELVSGMAVSRNLESIVRQLLSHLSPPSSAGASAGASAAVDATGAAAAALRASLASGGAATDADPTSSSLAAITSAYNPTLSPSYRLEIVQRILALGSYDTYANVVDFSWYIDTLLHLATVPNLPDGNDVGARIRDQLIDVTARVRAIRPHATRAMVALLRDGRLLPSSDWPAASSARKSAASSSAGTGEDMRETRKVLHAAAWILGEYAYELSSPGGTIPVLLTPALYDASICDASTSAACVHGAVKIYAFWASSISSRWADDGRKPQVDFDDIAVVTKQVVARLEAVQTMAVDAEVQERTVEYRQLFRLIEKDLEAHAPTSTEADKAAEVEGVSEYKLQGARPPRSLDLLSPLFFNHALGPLGPNAQARVAAPFDVDLQAWIVNPDAYVVLDGIDLAAHAEFDDETIAEAPAAPEPPKPSAKESKAQREARLQRQRDDPFYIVDSARQPSSAADKGGERDDDVDDIPIVRLDSLMDAAPAPAKLQPRVLEAEEMPADVPKPKPKPKPKKAAKSVASPADAPNDDGAATPTKVVRVKKKKAASKPAASQVTID
ncbi:adaptor protein complex AP-3 delta subunit [Moesziomyces antarcticus]|uniref:Related to Adapter-related protein complex 3 delta 1 subunit n=2 Tax=Pseudozyma antarctica TaxID=84753 RepID=A0A5C3FR15_PSEA2|nr:adaptor protein complex AP-3 delta subunit [Moesziomyces antarcticus]GAK64807.1 adaptor protein complex AP-3 delta subunit [Moesziomyces antarcticus]SPO45799.1 related to Adapter-related protein complex 3 delta 1 subunit [Moesziomyces antarcticus]